jgi:hypothetical protein
MEFDLFQNPVWCVYYVFSTLVFLAHGYWGWKKLVPAPAFRIPKGHVQRVINLGHGIFAFVALCYLSFPTYCYFFDMKPGNLGHV